VLKVSLDTLKKIPRILLIVFFILLVMDIVVIVASYLTGYKSMYGLVPLFIFDYENNIPTYFATLNLLLSSGLLYLIYRSYQDNSRAGSKYWLSLAVIFFVLSIDEGASLHELLIRPLREWFDITEGIFYATWVIPGIIICLIFVLFFLKFYLRFPLRYKILFGISAVLFISGVIVLEIIDSLFWGESGNNLTYFFLTTVEESLDMLGVILFIYTLVKYISEEIKSVAFEIA